MIESRNVQIATKPTEEEFGRFFGITFIITSLALSFTTKWELATFFACLSIFFLMTVKIQPENLGYLNEAWHKLGILLGKMTNPLVMGFVFYLVLTPFALVLKLKGRDELKIRTSNSLSYWEKREFPETSFEKQY